MEGLMNKWKKRRKKGNFLEYFFWSFFFLLLFYNRLTTITTDLNPSQKFDTPMITASKNTGWEKEWNCNKKPFFFIFFNSIFSVCLFYYYLITDHHTQILFYKHRQTSSLHQGLSATYQGPRASVPRSCPFDCTIPHYLSIAFP